MRLEGIDTLRGLAVSFVIVYHFFAIFELYDNMLFKYIHAFGIFGVSLFFIISGYLIYRSIDYNISKQGIKNGIKRYIIHRIFRIIPAYYFNLIIIFVLALVMFETISTWSFGFMMKQILSHLTFTTFFIDKITGFGINGAYWTLHVEMLWYILAVLMFIFIKKDRYLFSLFVLNIFYLMGLDYALFDSLFGLDEKSSNYIILLYYWSFQIFGQLIYFIAGIFIYKHLKMNITVSKLVAYLLFLLIISIFIYTSTQKYFIESFTIKNIVTLLLTASLFILLHKHKMPEFDFLAWIGKISYSLYLWHLPLLYIVTKYSLASDMPLAISLGIYMVILLSISSLSYYFIEELGFRCRQKLENKYL